MVIKKMVRDLDMNIKIVAVPTVREPDGLALSSRNVYLNTEERRQAVVLYLSLKLAEQLYRRGEKDADSVRQQMISLINQEPLAVVDYVSIADTETLQELKTISPPALVSMAVRFGTTRLIDNLVLE
jgi:pantoate--beta-alanine ligase